MTFATRPLAASAAVLAVVLTAAGCASVSAQDGASRAPVSSGAPELNLAYDRFVLDNGLTVVVHEDRKAPVVAVSIWYHVGSKNEPEGKTGFAHLFEHLMFQGSLSVEGEYFEPLQAVGASINGTTSFDRTNYFETVPAESLELALWLESDRMGYLEVSQERLDAQRDIVLNERRQSYENRPYGPSDLALYDALFPKGHPYHGNVIGSVEDLERATLTDVREFHRDFYTPSNATLALAGAFDVALAKSWIEKYFATLPHRPAPSRRKHQTPPLAAAKRLEVIEPVRLPRVAIAWIVPPAFAPAEAAVELSLEVLGSGKSSRLYQRLVQTGAAIDVSVWLDDAELASVAGIEVSLPEGGDPHAVEAAVREEVGKLAQQPPSAAELHRALKGLQVGLASSLQLLNTGNGSGGRAGLLQKLNHYLSRPGALPEVLQHLSRTTMQDVKQATAEHLSASRSLSVITLPSETLGNHSEQSQQ